MRLWDVEHPYYWNEGSYHENGMHETWDSWADFRDGMGAADEDLNLVCRFDWKNGEGEEENGVPIGEARLFIFYVAQRKAYTFSHEITVTREQEPEIRAWLAAKWEHVRRLWAPLSTGPRDDASGAKG